MVDSAYEHGIIEQLQENSGASTVKLLDTNNTYKEKIFFATQDNFNIIKSQLHNYAIDPNQLRPQEGYFVILPENGDICIDQWCGLGYILASNDNIGMIIAANSYNYYGGYSGFPLPINIPMVHDETIVPDISTLAYLETPKSEEPVDMASGAYLYDHVDYSLGSMEPLQLVRSYNSSAHYRKGYFGYGWTHNYNIYLEEHSDAATGLGTRLPIDAASSIAGLYVCFDLLKNPYKSTSVGIEQ